MSYKSNQSRFSTSFYTSHSATLRVPITFPETSPYTKQEFKDECDINVIMSRYSKSGQMPVINQVAPQYLDVSSVAEFQDAMQFVAGAQSLFNDLPAALRARFQNNPSQFLEFCGNPNNRDEMASLGLLKPEVASSILSPPVVTPESNPAPVAAVPAT